MMSEVHVEIVAKQKGCILCDLAIGILEEIEPEFTPGMLRWSVVDVGDRSGLARVEELFRICGKRPSIPSIVINQKIAFDHIPDMETLTRVIREAISDTPSTLLNVN
ncbi:MAG: hypothetical protein WA151_16540 [Desulfatirhabdiaceae bacterium]